MKNRMLPLVICFVFFALATFTSCEEDDNTLYPEVGPFDKVVVAHNVLVRLMNGNPDLVVSGSGDLSSVQLVVSDGILTVALPNPGTAQNVVVDIYHNDLVSLSCTQNGAVNFASDFSTSSHTLTITGYNAAAIYSYNTISVDTLDILLSDDTFLGFTQVDVSKNKLTLRSGSLCFLEGTATDQLIEISGDCLYNLEDADSGWPFSGPLTAENTWVNVRNGAEAWVHASSYLNAVGTTAGMIYYKGDPATIEENMTNGAELIQKNE